MKIHGNPRESKEIREFHVNPRNSKEISKSQWNTMEIKGNLKKSTEIPGIPYESKKTLESL